MKDKTNNQSFFFELNHDSLALCEELLSTNNIIITDMTRKILKLIHIFILLISISCIEDGGIEEDVTDDEVTDIAEPRTGEFVVFINGEQRKAIIVKAIDYEVRLEIIGTFEDSSKIVVDLFQPNERGEYEIDGQAEFKFPYQSNRISYYTNQETPWLEFQSDYNDEAKGVISVDLDLKQKLVSGFLESITLDETFKISKLSFIAVPIGDYLLPDPSPLKNRFFVSEIDGRNQVFKVSNAFEGPYVDRYGSIAEYVSVHSFLRWYKSTFYGDTEVQIMFISKDTIPFSYHSKFMAVGTLPFGKSADSFKDYQEGVVVSYRDPKGVLWSSDGGDQASSFFEITNHIRANSLASATIEGKFDCTLYDGSGNSIKLLNSEFAAYAIFLNIK